MTLQEAYDKALEMDGKNASVSNNMAMHPDPSIGTFESFAVTTCGLFAHGSSWKDCFNQIAAQDPAKAKAEKVAKLKAELEELES
jgi:hypothetical protein